MSVSSATTARSRTSGATGTAPRPATAARVGPDTVWRVDVLTGPEVAADPSPWDDAYATVYADALHLPDHHSPPFAARLGYSASRPGFRLAACHADGAPAGFAYGYTLPTTTGWWDGFVPAPGVDADEVAREREGRTFALCEVLVLPPFRGGGAVERTLSLLLGGRGEERAASLVARDNTRALGIFLANGWQHVGDVAPHPGWRDHHSLVMPLRH